MLRDLPAPRVASDMYEKSSNMALTWAFVSGDYCESLMSCGGDSAHTRSDLRIRRRPRWADCGAPCYPRHSERGFEPMVFSVGETVVYPHHGAALIEAIETRIVKGGGETDPAPRGRP